MQKVWNMVTMALMAVVAVLALLLMGVRPFGIQVFTVLSGSMEPTYQTGSLIYVKDVDYRDLREGDVITFTLSEDTVATHRIVSLVPDGEDPNLIRYRTKGDANNTEDHSLVHYKNILGTPVFTIPKLGYVAHYIQNPPGNYLTIGACVILLLLACIPEPSDTGESGREKASKSERHKKKKRQKGGKYLWK